MFQLPAVPIERPRLVPLDSSALGSVALSLDDMVVRIRSLIADAPDDDEIVGELREVERQLHTASRRLAKAVRRL